MYTSFIGRKFLKLYNQKNNSNLSAKEYFEKEFFPLFYDYPKYLQSPANTPLFQLIAQRKTDVPEERENKKLEISKKIEEYSNSDYSFPEMSFAIGFPSADVLGTTSGQITSLKLPFEEEDLYASWIGAAFGIGVKGGYSILIDNDEVLNAIYEGWKLYRDYVNQTEGISNKIESWNSAWLNHRLSDDWVESNPRANFQPLKTTKDNLNIERRSWVQILFALTRKLNNQNLTIYVYSLGQMNKTIGFIQLKLPEVKRFSDLFEYLFKSKLGITNKKLSELYETEYGFNIACQKFGLLGLRAIEPKDFKKFTPFTKYEKIPKFKTDEKSIINYSIYITWVAAMLNNKELLELAEKTAEKLIEFISKQKKVSRNRDNLVNNFLSSRNRKDFINRVTEIVDEDENMTSLANELVDRIMLDIAPDQLFLFVTLIRFKYMSKNKL